MKKKILSLMLAICIALSLFAGMTFTVSAYEIEGNYQYTISNGEVTIVRVINIVDNMTIPSTIIGFPVKYIGNYTFSGCTGLTSIMIPDSVTSIGNYAFKDCTGLTSITIPNSVKSIGEGAFSGCSSLEEMIIPFVGYQRSANSSVNSYDNWYGAPFGYIFGTSSYSGGIATVQLAPEYEYRISKTFYIPATLKKITITDATGIFDSAFSGCSGLTSITIGNSVKTICDSAFSNCSGLTSITIPNSVKTIGRFAFSGCSGLTSITIGNSVTSIGNYAFYNCTGLKSITIPDSVTSIGNAAFYGCKGFTSVTIGNSVKSIGEDAFHNCTGLTNVLIPKSVTSIGDSAFNSTSINDIYYTGTEQQKNKMILGAYIGRFNDRLINATWHYINFPDVSYTSWYGLSVAYAVSSGLMKGYGSGKFGTADGIQRQDFVVILSRLSGDDLSKYEGKVSFKDVSKGAYYATALAWAKDKKVSSGYANGKFGVGDKVTREQIMVFLYNYAKLKGYDTTATMTEAQAKATYADFGKVSGYAKEAALWALSKGVVSGKDAGGGKKLIAPQANALRCEVAAMFYNIEQKNIFAEE